MNESTQIEPGDHIPCPTCGADRDFSVLHRWLPEPFCLQPYWQQPEWVDVIQAAPCEHCSDKRKLVELNPWLAQWQPGC